MVRFSVSVVSEVFYLLYKLEFVNLPNAFFAYLNQLRIYRQVITDYYFYTYLYTTLVGTSENRRSHQMPYDISLPFH